MAFLSTSLFFVFALWKDPLIRDVSSFVDLLRANTTLTELRNYRLCTLFSVLSASASLLTCENQIADCCFHQRLDQVNQFCTTLWRNWHWHVCCFLPLFWLLLQTVTNSFEQGISWKLLNDVSSVWVNLDLFFQIWKSWPSLTLDFHALGMNRCTTWRSWTSLGWRTLLVNHLMLWFPCWSRCPSLKSWHLPSRMALVHLRFSSTNSLSFHPSHRCIWCVCVVPLLFNFVWNITLTISLWLQTQQMQESPVNHLWWLRSYAPSGWKSVHYHWMQQQHWLNSSVLRLRASTHSFLIETIGMCLCGTSSFLLLLVQTFRHCFVCWLFTRTSLFFSMSQFFIHLLNFQVTSGHWTRCSSWMLNWKRTKTQR